MVQQNPSLQRLEVMRNWVAFVRYFIGGQRYRQPTSHLLSVKQEAGESLRMYITRFKKEVLQVDKAED